VGDSSAAVTLFLGRLSPAETVDVVSGDPAQVVDLAVPSLLRPAADVLDDPLGDADPAPGRVVDDRLDLDLPPSPFESVETNYRFLR